MSGNEGSDVMDDENLYGDLKVGDMAFIMSYDNNLLYKHPIQKITKKHIYIRGITFPKKTLYHRYDSWNGVNLVLSTPETEETYRKQQLCMKFDKIVREIATISPKLKSVPLEDISVENIGEFVQVVETLKQDLLNLYSPRLVDYGRK